MLEETVRTMAPYSFGVSPYSPKDIHAMDSILARAKRKILRLPRSFPTLALVGSKEEGLWGQGSLYKEYIQTTTAILTHKLNDEGRLGMVTRALLNRQLAYLHKHPLLNSTHCPKILGTCTPLRQLHLLQSTGLTLLKDQKEAFPPYSPTDLQNLSKLFSYDPHHTGTPQQIPSSILCTLWELNLVTLHDILLPHTPTPTCISTADMPFRCTGKVLTRHKVALNRLTALLNDDIPPGQNILKYNSAQPRPLDKRTVAPSYAHLRHTHPLTQCRHTLDYIWAQQENIPPPQDTAPKPSTHPSPPAPPQQTTHRNQPHRITKKDAHTWEVTPKITPTPTHCTACGEPPTTEMIPCGTCGTTHLHTHCHTNTIPYTGQWHCHACSSSPTWEATQWTKTMQNYNAQRVKKKRHILDYMHQPYPCDTMPEGDNHRRYWTSWTDFKAYALNPASPQDPYLYYALYNEQDVPQALHSRPISVKATQVPEGKKARRQIPAAIQHQVEVEWKAAYYLPQHLPTIRLMGYTPASVIYVTPSHTLAGHIPLLLRPLCTEQTPLICITWNPREEHLEGLQANFGPLIATLQEQFNLKQTRLEQQQIMEKHPQHGLTTAQRQGIWDITNPYTPSRYPLLGNKVTINTRPINPDMDIHPTPQITLESDHTHPQLTHCYTSQGTYQAKAASTPPTSKP